MGPQQAALNTDGCDLDLANLRGSANSLGFDALGSASDRSASDIPDAQLAALNPGDWIALVTTEPAQAADIAKRLNQARRAVGPTQWLKVTVERVPLFLELVPIIATPSNSS
jgi:hypothetical protein